MPIRLKDYGRNQKKRKEYIHLIGLLLDGMDVNMANHNASEETLEDARK